MLNARSLRVPTPQKTAQETIMGGSDSLAGKSHHQREPARQGQESEDQSSQTLEERLAQAVREAEAEKWLVANRKAIDADNERVERNGAWNDKFKGF
jgi:post-segregation antitoxin (ccd killing protein)